MVPLMVPPDAEVDVAPELPHPASNDTSAQSSTPHESQRANIASRIPFSLCASATSTSVDGGAEQAMCPALQLESADLRTCCAAFSTNRECGTHSLFLADKTTTLGSPHARQL